MPEIGELVMRIRISSKDYDAFMKVYNALRKLFKSLGVIKKIVPIYNKYKVSPETGIEEKWWITEFYISPVGDVPDRVMDIIKKGQIPSPQGPIPFPKDVKIDVSITKEVIPIPTTHKGRVKTPEKRPTERKVVRPVTYVPEEYTVIASSYDYDKLMKFIEAFSTDIVNTGSILSDRSIYRCPFGREYTEEISSFTVTRSIEVRPYTIAKVYITIPVSRKGAAKGVGFRVEYEPSFLYYGLIREAARRFPEIIDYLRREIPVETLFAEHPEIRAAYGANREFIEQYNATLNIIRAQKGIGNVLIHVEYEKPIISYPPTVKISLDNKELFYGVLHPSGAMGAKYPLEVERRGVPVGIHNLTIELSRYVVSSRESAIMYVAIFHVVATSKLVELLARLKAKNPKRFAYVKGTRMPSYIKECEKIA